MSQLEKIKPQDLKARRRTLLVVKSINWPSKMFTVHDVTEGKDKLLSVSPLRMEFAIKKFLSLAPGRTVNDLVGCTLRITGMGSVYQADFLTDTPLDSDNAPV